MIYRSFAVTVLLAFASTTVFGITQELSATVGDTVNITCLFGDGTLRNIYWYYHNTQKIVTLTKGDLMVEQPYIGRAGLQKDNATLYLKDITIADEGTYRCDVDRQGQPAVLDIISELKVYAFELHTERTVKVVRGRNASLICSFTDPANAVYWYKHNSTGAPDDDAELVAREFLGRSDPLPGIDRFRITEDYRLLISDVSIADETTYSCFVLLQTGITNRGYTDLKVIVLADSLGPKIGSCNTFVPGECTYNVPTDPPEEVVLVCELCGVRPLVNLEWVRSDDKVEQALGPLIVEKDGLHDVASILKVPKSAFEYHYLCQATGDAVQNASMKVTFEEGTVSGWSHTSVIGVTVGLVVIGIAPVLCFWMFCARAKATKRYRLNMVNTDPESSHLDKQDGEQANLKSLQGENVENEYEEERAKFEQEEKQSLESRLREYELNKKELERVISKQRSQLESRQNRTITMVEILTEEKLWDIAESLAVNNKLLKFGQKLGIKRSKVKMYIDTNRRNESFDGTINMLFDWKRKTPRAKQIPDLKKALYETGLAELVDEFFSSGGDPSGIDSSELQEEGHATELSPMIDVRGGGTMSMSRRVITRASLGRMANLGTLYDARTESFLINNLFISGHEDSMMVDEMGLDETEIEMTICDSFHEMCQDLDVEPELELSVAAGMVKLGGSGAYLGDEWKSSTGQRMSLIYKLKTVNEEVMLRQIRDIIDYDKLADKYLDATHVVVGIDWGALCTIICVCENTESDKDAKVRKEIKEKLGALKNVLNANESAKARVEDIGYDDMRKFSFEYRTDVEFSCPNMPETLEETLDHARNFLTKVKNTNNGKGVPVKYYLMPLATVRKHFHVKAASTTIYNKVHERSVRKAVKVFEIVQKNCQKVHDIHQDMTLHSQFITDEALERIKLILREVTEKESRFKSDLQEVVKKVRTDEERLDSFEHVEEFLGKMKHEDISASNYVEIFEPHLTKARLMASMTSKGIKYVRKQEVLVNFDAKPNTYVFYMPKGGDSKVFKKNHDFLIRLCSTFSGDGRREFIVVDQEIVTRHVWPDKETKPVIKKYVNGKLISNDLYEEEGKYLEMCMMQVCNPRPCTSRACTERAFAKLRCPNSVTECGRCGCCQCMWRCSKCKQFVEYSTTSNLFHCKCGDSNPKDALFRCNDPHHGMNFMKYKKDLLNANLSHLKPKREYNILLLGETGVGKSTFINAVYNYLSFANLSEAMSSEDLHVLIPSSFSMTKDGEQREMNVGDMGDGNEMHENGKSETMKPKSYVVIDGDRRLRFIDTPGFGNCAETRQDEINMKNILSYIPYYSEIHAICILLKPNYSRLALVSVEELLVKFHKSAYDNIVFCFTNARQTFYQAGDTLPAFNKVRTQKRVGIGARNDNVFCFDNETFRFLACTKNGITFSNSEIASYSTSWDKSAEETKRLLFYIERVLKPHNVKETIDLIEARRNIIAYVKPKLTEREAHK